MILECGYYDIDTTIHNKYGHKYFVCNHRCNFSKVELVFIRGKKLSGKYELCEAIKSEFRGKYE